MGKAMGIIMTGRDGTADEALRIGLVGRAAPSGTFETEVRRLAEAIAATGPLGNRAVKKLGRALLHGERRTARAMGVTPMTIVRRLDADPLTREVLRQVD